MEREEEEGKLLKGRLNRCRVTCAILLGGSQSQLTI